jgi:hypothetical protein
MVEDAEPSPPYRAYELHRPYDRAWHKPRTDFRMEEG